jgi:hypothetical protein
MTPSATLLPIILGLIQKAENEQDILAQFFKFNMEYGLRWNEFAPDRWTYNSGRYFTVQTLKKGNPRSVFIPEDLEILWDVYKNGMAVVSYGYSNTRYRMQNWLYPIQLVHGENTVDTHLFRYYVAKVRYESGQTIPQISNFLGDKKAISATPYVMATIIPTVIP